MLFWFRKQLSNCKSNLNRLRVTTTDVTKNTNQSILNSFTYQQYHRSMKYTINYKWTLIISNETTNYYDEIFIWIIEMKKYTGISNSEIKDIFTGLCFIFSSICNNFQIKRIIQRIIGHNWFSYLSTNSRHFPALLFWLSMETIILKTNQIWFNHAITGKI